MVNLEHRFDTFRTNVTKEFLKLLVEATGVSEDDLKTLDVGFDVQEQAVIFADRGPNGRIINLVRWFRDDTKRSLVADENELVYIMTKDVPQYIKAKIAGDLLWCVHAPSIAEQFIEEFWIDENGRLNHSYYTYYRRDMTNNMLWDWLKDKDYIEKKLIRGDLFTVCRQYKPTIAKIKSIRWNLRFEVQRILAQQATIGTRKE